MAFGLESASAGQHALNRATTLDALRSLWLKRAIITTITVLGLGVGCSNSSEPGDVAASTAAPTVSELPTTRAPADVTSTAPQGVATTQPPECRRNETRFVDEVRERCVEGTWEPFPIATSPSTSSTTSTTTTTIAPGDEADVQALFLLNGIESDEATDLIDAFIETLEAPTLLDRVDLLSARIDDDLTGWIIVVGRSGYSGEEFQLEVTIDTLTELAELWDVPALAGEGTLKVGIELTVDDRSFVIPHADVIALNRRQVTPEAVLGI